MAMTEPMKFSLELLGLPVTVVFSPNVVPGLHRFDFHSNQAPAPFSLVGHRIHFQWAEAVQAKGVEAYASEWITEQAAHRLLSP